MPRPMTAEDRDPQVGDVLRYHGKNATVQDAQKGYYHWTRWQWRYGRIWYLLPHGGREHRYVSRADGGPVEVE